VKALNRHAAEDHQYIAYLLHHASPSRLSAACICPSGHGQAWPRA